MIGLSKSKMSIEIHHGVVYALSMENVTEVYEKLPRYSGIRSVHEYPGLMLESLYNGIINDFAADESEIGFVELVLILELCAEIFAGQEFRRIFFADPMILIAPKQFQQSSPMQPSMAVGIYDDVDDLGLSRPVRHARFIQTENHRLFPLQSL